MIDWTARAKARFSQTPQELPDKTDETCRAVLDKPEDGTAKTDKTGVSSVSSVGVVALFENRMLSADLMEAAMLVCDLHGDDEKAREDMRQDVANTPFEQRADLLEYFRGRAAQMQRQRPWLSITKINP